MSRQLIRRHLSALLATSVLLAAAGCSADETDAVATTDTSAPSDVTTSAETSTTATTAPRSTITTDRTVEPADDCRRIADLESNDELQRWRVVNDGVMGGQSSGGIEVEASVLIIEGEIVTDGGGFSSIRLQLDEPLGDATSLRFRIRTDGRRYELTASDATQGQDRRISHQGPIPADGGDAWEEVEVDLATLKASIFGQAVDTDPFDPTTAVEIGIILADGIDGPFRFELDWISVCS